MRGRCASPGGGRTVETQQIRAKVTLVGDKAVGKTSLIRRFVLDEYSDDYLLTLGAKVMKKSVTVAVPGRDLSLDVELGIWDIMGQTRFRDIVKEAYFHGTSGVLAVIDLTRWDTLGGIAAWVDAVREVAGPVPVVLVVNKKDLSSAARFGEKDMEEIARVLGCEYLLTSAKTGENVEETFRRVAMGIAARHLHA